LLVVNYEQLLRAVFFSYFLGQKFNFSFSFYIVGSALKSCLIQKWKRFFLNLGNIFGGLKTGFFRASCFGYRVKGVSPLLLPLVSLDQTHVHITYMYVCIFRLFLMIFPKQKYFWLFFLFPTWTIKLSWVYVIGIVSERVLYVLHMVLHVIQKRRDTHVGGVIWVSGP
jgi:hypothetical protein